MDKFATLEPVRLYAQSGGRGLLSRSTPTAKATLAPPLVGRLPSDLHLLVLSHLPIPDFPAYSRCSHSTAALAQDETVWEKRWKALGVDKHVLAPVLDDLEHRSQDRAAASRAAAPPTISVDDEFGDFGDADVLSPPPEEMGDFVGAFAGVSMSPRTPAFGAHQKETYRAKFVRAHNLLRPLTKALGSPPHLVLSQLAEAVRGTLGKEAKTLRLMSLYLSAKVQPVRKWEVLYLALRSAMDRFDANVLAAFDIADSKGDESGMKEAAESSWEVWDGSGDWEMGKVWAEKREIFYESGKWDPLDNFTKDGALDFDAMDEFIAAILSAITEHGSRAVRVFPPSSQVLISFSERLATDVVGEYITSLLTRARELSNETYLKATAASFREAWRMVDAIMQAAKQSKDSNISKTRAEDVVYQMFEINMDEYLDEEVESLKVTFETICNGWDRQMSSSAASPLLDNTTTRFLTSQNPAQVKRNVLASFTSVLLLPVTIVPRTVGAVGGALMTGGSAAVQGISMLNPQRWGGGGTPSGGAIGYSKDLEKDNNMLFEAELDDGEEEEILDEKSGFEYGNDDSPTQSISQVKATNSRSSTATHLSSSSSTSKPANQLDLLLSLDIALELIHADRESLKRVETFAGYPGHYGHRVRDTIEEIFILMLQALGERHVSKGFSQATERMTAYKPAEHEETTSVAPLLQFFELVHVGDTIQSMVQVYFDKELAPHIDKTDFLNGVVREKKRFENSLDDSVAGGLNAGTEVLMNQVEHIILTLTKPREYYPPEDGQLDLGPTKGCTEAIRCLEMHCKLLKGSTSKEVLEVFYQEVGIRLIAIIQKHIKRQIISLNGGFQVIADLNTYHAFISSLKVPAITADFSHLKMLGHVFVVEDAKDLAQIVRDVTRYGGAYRPEDIYEFIQRRSDWKRIEKTVDKTMYNLSFKDDCIIC
ncbi:f-box protein pof6 [Crucibulum laeve]|uniref:F-box protein pof6 n=1 Tax=Crucibulum laeve TaxID=68775 RepID=A0A5C3LPJ7_9AGAR|nr:f-box protein pof6 [Crucibulum laeve]